MNQYTIPEQRRLFATQAAAWKKRNAAVWLGGFWVGLLFGLGGSVLAVSLTLYLTGSIK